MTSGKGRACNSYSEAVYHPLANLKGKNIKYPAGNYKQLLSFIHFCFGLSVSVIGGQQF